MWGWLWAKVRLDLGGKHWNVVRRLAYCTFGIISCTQMLCELNSLGGVMGESGVGFGRVSGWFWEPFAVDEVWV